MVEKAFRWALGLVLASLWLTACGDQSTLQLSAHTLLFDDQLDRPWSRSIIGTISPLDHDVYIGVLCSDNAVKCTYDLSSYNTSYNSFSVTVTPKDPEVLASGTYKDQVIIAVCEDEACNKHISGSPSIVEVSYTLSHPIRFDPKQLSFTAVVGSSAQSSQTMLSFDARFVFSWKASADQSWIRLPTWYGDRNFPVEVDPSGLAVGSYSGSITLTTNLGDTYTIPVTLEMVSATLSTEP